MSQTKNEYAEKQRRKALDGTTAVTHNVETKGDLKKTGAYFVRDLVIGGLGGALTGKIIGRPSLLIGMAVSGAGHYFGSPTTAMFGVGLMASGGVQTLNSAVNGTDKKGLETVKERFSDFAHNLKRQLYLDKLIPSKKKTETTKDDESTNGVGNVQYFKHPNPEDSDLNGNAELDFTEANKLEQQIEASAKQFAQKQAMSGDFSGTETEEVSGLEEDISERLM